MKLTLKWLKDYLDLDAPSHCSVSDIVAKLTALGLEVDDVQNKAELYAPFKVAKVKSAVQHPNADRLKVCQVETEDGVVQVVCGAPNARTGMTGIFAPVGSYIPGLDVTLEKGKIRGEDSYGMLVSEREMSLSDEHDGIIDLDEAHAIGTPITDIFDGLNDVIIEIGLTPDRADCAGILGIARDLSAGGCGQFIIPEAKAIEETHQSPVTVHLEAREACPHFMSRHIKGVKNGESPDWLKARLKAVGLRPISALVDITNFFTIGIARPLHVYDAARLKGDIRVQTATGGEVIPALNDKTYTLKGGETIIADDSGAIGLGGIIGGTSTAVEADTTDIILECAYFDPTVTAVTGRAHQIISDARYRFERGVDPAFLPQALDLATEMILDICGGEASEVFEAGHPINWQRTYVFNTALTQKMTGVKIYEQEQLYILGSLGFEIDGSHTPYDVSPPSWRGDIQGVADLVEEIIRVYGYDKIEAVPVTREKPLTESALSKTHENRMKAGRALAMQGLQECITWSFMAHDMAEVFTDGKVKPALKLTNPLSVELGTMRPSILPNLLAAAGRNADRGYGNAALFEIGPVFHGVDPDDQAMMAAGVRHNVAHDKHWSNGDAGRNVDVYDVKADTLAAIQAINPTLNPQIDSAGAPSWYHPGRSASFRLGKNMLATFGEIHPAILETMDVDAPVVGFEVYLDNIPPAKKQNVKKPLKLSAYQPVKRDFAFIVDEDISGEAILSAVKKGAGDMLSEASIFDIYQGQGVAEGKKSVAVSTLFIPQDKTLTDKHIEELAQSIIAQVKSKTGAELRG